MDAMKHAAIRRDILQQLQAVGHFDKLEFVYLFGSTATGDATEQSDVDICLHYTNISQHVLQKVYVTIPAVLTDYNISFFRYLPLHLKKAVFAGQLLYCKDEDSVYDMAFQTIRAHDEFEKHCKLVIA